MRTCEFLRDATGGRLAKRASYYSLFLAEGHQNRGRFGAMLRRIALLPVAAGERMLDKLVLDHRGLG